MNACRIRGEAYERVGFLYMQTEHFVILLNNVVKGADLGSLQLLRKQQVEPEADITILPKSDIKEIELLGPA